MTLLPIKSIRQGQNFPLSKAWCYKAIHLQKHSGLFVKIDGAVFVDLDQFQALAEKGRLGGKGGTR